MNRDITIIGAGPIGLFCVLQAGILGLKCNVIEALPFVGGQCSALYPHKLLKNIPGHLSIKAEDLISELYKQAIQFNPKFYLENIAKKLEIYKDKFLIKTDKNIVLETKALILAIGKGIFSYKKPQQIYDIESYENKSIFYSVQNLNIFYEKTVVILGGGDSSVDWTIALSSVATKIYLVHYKEKFSCKHSSLNYINELVLSGKVELLTSYQIKEVFGKNGKIEAVTVYNSTGLEKILITDLLLIFYGLKTNTGVIEDWPISLDQNYIVVDKVNFSTNLKGVYAVGDATSYEGKIRLIPVGFSEAIVSAHNIYKTIL